MEVPAPFAGTITAFQAEPGQQIKVGDTVLSYTAGAAAEVEAAEKNGPQPSSTPLPKSRERKQAPSRLTPQTVKAAPSVRYMARKLGIDLARVHGSGPEGRVLIGDLTDRLNDLTVATGGSPVGLAEPAGGPPAATNLAKERPDYGTPGTRIKFQGVRRKIAEHMALAKQTIPHYSYMDECEVTDLVHLRESLKPRFARAGLKLTYLPFLVKAAVAGLQAVPLANASLDEKAGEIVLHDRYHIGFAVAAPSGLIVPVIKDADQKSIVEIAREIDRLSSEARAGKSRLEDLREGTFTVTSIGSLGGLISTPVINHPQVGIVGIGKIVKRPVYDAGGQLRPAEIVYLSFSFDHRVVDGAVAVAFGNAVIRSLQAPGEMLLSVSL